MGHIRLGRIAGIEIRLDFSWFLVFFVLTWTLGLGVFPVAYRLPQPLALGMGSVAAVLLFASVVVHELSHALVARAQGSEVTGITLFLFGGVAQIKGEPETPRAEFLIAVVGPVVSFLLAAVCLGVWLLLGGPYTMLAPDGRHAVGALFNYLGVINAVLALFNLIPGFPLDGGRILRSGLWAWTGDLIKATRWASAGGQIFGWLAVAWGIRDVVVDNRLTGLWLVFVGWFLTLSARAALQQLVLKRTLREVPVSAVMSHGAPAVDGDLRIPEFVERYLLPGEHRSFPVVRQGEFLGVISAEEVARLEREYWGVTCVAALARMPEGEGVVDGSENAWAALTRMLESDAERLLVERNGKVEGVVSREAILRLAPGKRRVSPPGPRAVS